MLGAGTILDTAWVYVANEGSMLRTTPTKSSSQSEFQYSRYNKNRKKSIILKMSRTFTLYNNKAVHKLIIIKVKTFLRAVGGLFR